MSSLSPAGDELDRTIPGLKDHARQLRAVLQSRCRSIPRADHVVGTSTCDGYGDSEISAYFYIVG
ncbi:MAG: hypothetical protein SXG53_19510 [Pseudomonadota bacterium]|nr:hypothetical protein [Pseudomonadota bacterium]